MLLRLLAGLFAHPVVPRLVLVVDPVEGLHRAILDAVLGDPLVRVAAALGQDARHHLHLLQVDLDPLVLVVELGEPRAAGKTQRENTSLRSKGRQIAPHFIINRPVFQISVHSTG